MKKYGISYRIVFFVLLAALLLSLVPILTVSRYSVPCADDYSYGVNTHRAYVQTGSFSRTVAEACREVAEVYTGWQGTFSAVFLMSLQPAVFGEQYYCLGTWMMLASLIIGTFCFCLALFSCVFGLHRSISGIIAAVLSIVCVQLVPSPAQAFFWYNGSVYYTFFHGVMLAAFALGIRALQKQGPWRWCLLCLLAVFLGGGNYVTALSCAIAGVFAEALLIRKKDKSRLKFLIPLGFLLAAFFISIAAPGNAVRQAAVEHTPSAVKAVIHSFKDGAIYSVRWMSLPLFGALVFLLPVFWNGVGGAAFQFRYPVLVTLFSYCLLSAMFCPSLYATNKEGDYRLLNIIYDTYVLLLVVNCCYWTGWLAMRASRKTERKEKLPLPAVLAVSMVCLACCGIHVRSGGFTAVMAMGSMRSGEAQAYYACAQRRLALLHDENAKDVVLEEYPYQPYVFYFTDISTDPADWKNVSICEYYDKDSVVLQGP